MPFLIPITIILSLKTLNKVGNQVRVRFVGRIITRFLAISSISSGICQVSCISSRWLRVCGELLENLRLDGGTVGSLDDEKDADGNLFEVVCVWRKKLRLEALIDI